MTLTNQHLDTFRDIVDTLLPAIEGDGPAWTTPGSQLGIEQHLPDLYARLPHDADRTDLRRFLSLLSSRAGGLLLFGKAKAFTAMPPDERAAAYRAMESHRLGLVRNGAAALKTAAAFLWVATEDPDARPDPWDTMAYPGPNGPAPDVPKPIPVEDISGDVTLDADVVVVGSGAGGGTAAGVLAAAGLRVVVLERGAYRNESDFDHLEATAYRDMYLDGALGTTADGGILMLAGATLGGGTVINYSTSFATPDAIRTEWDSVAGFDGVFTGDRFRDATESVQSRLSINSLNGPPALRAELLEKGLRARGWHVAEMPRNATGCTEDECGYCTLGCRIGAKRSTLLTYLQDAAHHGARFVTGADVRRITTVNGKATGVIATVGGATLTVTARAVVLAAGALSTPPILLASGLGGPAVGKFLHLHPVTAVWGRFAERVDPWMGVLQTRYSNEFADLDGRGHGFKFEEAPIHPLFPAAFVGWEDGASFKRDVLGLGHLAVAGILLRDRDHGRVTTRRDGSPVWKYAISDYDAAHIREGVLRGAEAMAAAGAEEIIASTMRPVRWRPGRGSLEGFMAGVDAIGYGSNRTRYFSFHQMGSARMGSDPRASVVGADNQSHDVRGLYVMDASCFPTASGVNPMLSIAAIAHRGASLLAERLAG